MNTENSFVGRHVNIDEKNITGIVTNFYENPHSGIPVLKVKVEQSAQSSARKFIFLSPEDVTFFEPLI